jgi:CheY-like chemotaxis protein
MTEDRVLIVDRNEAFLRELEQVLLAAGYDTVAVSSAQAVPSLARTARPSVIILDLDMPGNQSLRAARALARCPATAAIPIIGTTFFAVDEESLEFLRDRRIGTCLIKPLTFLELVGKIEIAQSGHTPPAALHEQGVAALGGETVVQKWSAEE